MRIVIWNAEAGNLTEQNIDRGEFLRELYDVIGCHTVDVASLLPTLDAWVDGEGLLHGGRKVLTQLRGYHSPLAGNIVFTGGVDGEGETQECTDTLEDLRRLIVWQRELA